MEKLAHAYKIGSKLALNRYLPKFSRNQLLALGGIGGLGGLGLGLSVHEGKVLAKGLVDDAVSAAGKSGLVDDAVSAAGIHGPDYEKFRALNNINKQIEIAQTKNFKVNRDFGYKPFITDEMIKLIRGPGHGLNPGRTITTQQQVNNARDFLAKQFSGSWERLDKALSSRSEAAYQAASKGTLSDLEGIRRGLISPGTQPEEVAAILKRFRNHELNALDVSTANYKKQISAAAQDLLKTFSQKK